MGKSIMSRQEVAFSEECREIKGPGSLREDFYTKFKPKNKGFGAVTWWKNWYLRREEMRNEKNDTGYHL